MPTGPVLAVDTTLHACSAAVWAEGRVVAEVFEVPTRAHAEKLPGMAAAVLAAAGLRHRDIARYAATTGPGGFSGVRVGLAALRGMALVRRTPVIGITTLAALAAPAALRGCPLLATVDAARGEVYVQAFDAAGVALGDPAALPPQDAAGLLPDGGIVIGTGAGHVMAFLPAAARGAEDLDLPRAGLVAMLAAHAPLPGHAPGPLYLRPPDAAIGRRTSLRAV